MAMEITSDYSNYAANYTDTMKKSVVMQQGR